jgi:hypothetical protein
MAKTNNAIAQRERRQKIFLAVGGVILIALLAIQGPKVLKQLKGSETAAPPVATTPAAVSPETGLPTTGVPQNVPAGKGSAVLVGVPVSPTGVPEPEEGQLWSFSRFEAKDPFEPNVSEQPAGPALSGGETSGGASETPKPAAKPSAQADTADSASSAVGGPVAPATGADTAPEPKPTNATIAVNGKPQQLEAKDLFPKADKTFVLVGFKDGAAKIGVAGGSFTDGNTVALKLGKQITLVDTATGARYVLKLLYLGVGPEQVESFSTGSQDK